MFLLFPNFVCKCMCNCHIIFQYISSFFKFLLCCTVEILTFYLKLGLTILKLGYCIHLLVTCYEKLIDGTAINSYLAVSSQYKVLKIFL